MARIRTIKPEFPQSESMGNVSRDARLLFVMLWTLCDDSGRTRAASRMLASLLFPYDDDAPSLIDGWLVELEEEGCIVRYSVGGSTYLQISNWLNHQKIDRPSESKIPAFDEGSRILANPRESSSLDQGPRTKDQGEDQGAGRAPAPSALGQACQAMREAGMGNLNQSDPALASALEAGVTPQELADTVREFPGKPLRYVCNTAAGRRRDAAQQPATPGNGKPGQRMTLSESRAIASASRLSSFTNPGASNHERTLEAPAPARILG